MNLELLVLATDFESIGIIDMSESCIWTDRYNQHGDFEITSGIQPSILSLCTPDNYLVTDHSEHVMIVEGQEITTDAEDGSLLIVTGRSLESILYRRIIWGQKILSGNLQDGVEVLLNENIINPTDPDRKISNFIFERSTDPLITALTIEGQYFGEYLYDIIQGLCSANKIGFKITLSDDNNFVFCLYAGADRTYDQTANPYVIFSPEFENLLNSNYLNTYKSFKNVGMAAGEGEGSARKIVSVGTSSGLSRKEYFCNASDVSKTTQTGTLTDAQYTEQLIQRLNEELSEYSDTIVFEGEVEATKTFIYGKDFFIGDTVQIENEYGSTGKAYVSEFIISQDQNGLSTYPSFTMIE